MIKPLEIHNAISQILKKKTGYKVYSNEVLEGFVAPCFFVSVFIKNFNNQGKSVLAVEAEASIEYYPYLDSEKRVRDEISSNKMIDILLSLFHLNLPVSDRHLLITDGRFSFGGQNKDLLKMDIGLSYFDSPDEREESGETITAVDINTKN